MDTPESLHFQYGDPRHPRGNALAYWQLTAHTGDDSFEKLIVTNFVVSPLYIGRQSVAATFPPQIIDSLDELMRLAQRAKVDLLFVRRVDLPAEEFDFESFFKQQLSYFNQLVASYTERYGLSLGTPEQPTDSTAQKDEIESLRDANRLTDEARKAFTIQHNATLAREMLIKIRRIIHSLNSPTYKYDIEELLLLLSNPDSRIDQLSTLYFKKFMAICTEQYEDAAQLRQAIRVLSHIIDSEGFSDKAPDSSQE